MHKNHKPIINIQNRGQSLVEAIVATAVVILLVTGLIAGTTSAIKIGQSNKYRSMGTKLAQDAVEKIRFDKENLGWNQFVGKYMPDSNSHQFCITDNMGNDYLSAYDGTCTYNVSEGSLNYSFNRNVTLTHITSGTPELVQVVVEVSWRDAAATRYSRAETQLTNWR